MSLALESPATAYMFGSGYSFPNLFSRCISRHHLLKKERFNMTMSEASTPSGLTMSGEDQFQQRFRLLPQALQDLIYDLIFTANVPEDRIWTIDIAYKPSQLLHVNSASRRKFALSFYGNDSIFCFESRNTLIAWYISLSQSHQAFVNTLRVNTDARTSDEPMLNHRRQNISGAMFGVQASLASRGVRLSPGTLYVSYR